MAGGAAIDARAAGRGDVLRHVRRDLLFATFHDEVGRVVGLIGAERDPPGAGPGPDELDRRQRLGVAGRPGRHPAHDQPVAVLHQRVPDVAELRRLAASLAVEPRVRVSGAGVGRVRALLALEVPLAVAPRPRRLVTAVLAAEALQAGPGLEQRAVHREVLARQQPLHLGQGQELRQEALRHLARQQPVAVLREHARVPHRVVHPETHEPAKQEVELQPLHQLPLRAHRVEALQQKRAQQPLRGDARTPDPRIERGEIRRQRGQRRVHHLADRPQRMVRANSRTRDRHRRTAVPSADPRPASLTPQLVTVLNFRNHAFADGTSQEFFSSLLDEAETPHRDEGLPGAGRSL